LGCTTISLQSKGHEAGDLQGGNRFRPTAQFDRFFHVFLLFFFFWEELHLLNCCPHKEFLRFAKKVTSFRFLNLNVFILI